MPHLRDFIPLLTDYLMFNEWFPTFRASSAFAAHLHMLSEWLSAYLDFDGSPNLFPVPSPSSSSGYITDM